MADVADDGLVLHAGHVVGHDDALVARRRDEDVGGLHDVFEAHDVEALHGGLQRTDRIDLGHDDLAALALQRCGAALADVAVAENDCGLATEHDVGAAVDAVDEAVADAVQVVELGLGDGVVHVDCGEQQFAGFLHVIEAVHTGRGLLGDATDTGGDLLPELVALLRPDRTELLHEDALFFGRVLRRLGDGAGLLELEALVHEHGGVATVVENQVRALAVGPVEQLHGGPPVLFERFALTSEDRDALRVRRRAVRAASDSGCGVVLGGEDVAGNPADVGAECRQRLDQHRRLDRHVQRPGDSGAGQRLAVAVLGAQRHEARHLVFGEPDFLAAELGQIEVGDLEVIRHGVFLLIARNHRRAIRHVRL